MLEGYNLVLRRDEPYEDFVEMSTRRIARIRRSGTWITYAAASRVFL
jgi:hypothetical protein